MSNMSQLLVLTPLFVSFLGIYYYALVTKHGNEIRFILFMLLCIIMDAVLSLMLWSDTGVLADVDAGTLMKTSLICSLALWVLTFLFFITFYFGTSFYKRLKVKKTACFRQNLINILLLQFEIGWVFLMVWFFMSFRTEELFSNTLYVFFKVMGITVSLTLYFYLFELYKDRLRQEKIARSKGFVSVPHMLVSTSLTSPTAPGASSIPGTSSIPGSLSTSVAPDTSTSPAIPGTSTTLGASTSPTSSTTPNSSVSPTTQTPQRSDKPTYASESRYKKSLLDVKKLNAYKNRVEEFFRTNKQAYLDIDFNMKVLSSSTGIPKYHLSQVFNVALQTSFSAYVNEKRIEHACQLIKESNGSLTVAELMEKCGFRSRASFYTYFKKITGCMPSQYLSP